MSGELLSFDFSKVDKESLLRVMRKYKSAPPHHDEVTNSLAVPGQTVLTEMEVRYLAGIVRPYYAYLSDRIETHPVLEEQGRMSRIRQAQMYLERAADDFHQAALYEATLTDGRNGTYISGYEELREAIKAMVEA